MSHENLSFEELAQIISNTEHNIKEAKKLTTTEYILLMEFHVKKYFDNKANELRKKWGQLEDSGLLLGAPINDIILTKKQEMKNEIESDIDYK